MKAMNANTIRIWSGNNRQVTIQDVQNPKSRWYNDWTSIGRITSYLTKRTFDTAQQYNLKIIAGFEMPWPGQFACVNGQLQYTRWTDFTDPDIRNDIITRFTAFIAQFKTHPALLCWAIGNENNEKSAAHTVILSPLRTMCRTGRSFRRRDCFYSGL